MYASFSSSRKPFWPMMSQIVMSILSSPEPSGDREVSSFFETFVPSVWMYLSSKFSKTNRRMRDVLPTAASPTRQTFTFIRLTSLENRPTTRHSLRGPLKRYGSVITDDTGESREPRVRLDGPNGIG